MNRRGVITATFRGGPCAGSRQIHTAYDPYDIVFRPPLPKDHRWKGLLDQIRTEVIPHAHAEEAVFYNALRELGQGKGIVLDSYREHATAEADPDATDTLMVIADRPWLTGVGANDTLVCPVAGEIVFFDNIPFADTTFVRNSGDFTHAFMGEGENVGSRFARALNYSASAGLVNRTDTDTISGVVFSCPTQIDRGVSPGIRVSDFISNTATKVTGIAVNFNGHTNVVRTTDSIYALDVGLRLGGTMAGSGANPGMDFHPDNDFDPFVGGTPFYGGGDNPNNRLVFSARVDGGIDVWDTYNFARVTTVPIRDPVIGPLRVAKGPGGTLILVGVTVRGVVTVRLPAIVNIFPSIYRGVNATR